VMDFGLVKLRRKPPIAHVTPHYALAPSCLVQMVELDTGFADAE
jgi:hypothetical protein